MTGRFWVYGPVDLAANAVELIGLSVPPNLPYLMLFQSS
jgi:hypothetical protein